MTDFRIPCDTFVRLCSVLQNFDDTANIWTNSVRVEDNIALATNRKIMAIENIATTYLPSAVLHIIPDPALVAQCKIEAAFNSVMTITVIDNDLIKNAVAKTSLGYVHPTNCAIFSDEINDTNRWREIVGYAEAPLTASSGAMFWSVDEILALASSSPSGKIVFEEFIDSYNRPVILRDIDTHDWMGIFNPMSSKENYQPATIPNWVLK